MSRDEARFPPERFPDDECMLNENDPMDFVFGFGRRICPGTCTYDSEMSDLQWFRLTLVGTVHCRCDALRLHRHDACDIRIFSCKRYPRQRRHFEGEMGRRDHSVSGSNITCGPSCDYMMSSRPESFPCRICPRTHVDKSYLTRDCP